MAFWQPWASICAEPTGFPRWGGIAEGREEVLASAMAAADEERLALDRADPGGLIVTSYVAFSNLLEKTMDDCLEFENVEDVLNFVLRRP